MTRPIDDLQEWLSYVSAPGWTWYAKYIAANDTYAKPNVHQGGPYLGKELLRAAFPLLTERAEHDKNPDLHVTANVASHRLVQDVRLIWYNSRRIEKRANGRDEARLTNWGGKEHPLVAEDATGSLAVFAFYQPTSGKDAEGIEVWITRSVDEEDLIISALGFVEPGKGISLTPAAGLLRTIARSRQSPCALRADELLPAWRDELPSGQAILDMVLARLQGRRRLGADARLLVRRACEYELFQSIESHVVLPRVKEGFANVEEFVRFSNSVTNRRKSRAGKSLELHARAIFNEEKVPHTWTPQTEDRRTPDFIFPSIELYHDKKWPAHKLRMLGAKTTCKDRWRQILNEAKRVGEKHLLTLQEGVSVPQFKEMREEGVRLVVPLGLHEKYPDELRGELLTFNAFIGEVKQLL